MLNRAWLGLCLTAYTLSAQAENLADVYQIALQNDPTFQAAEAALGVGKQAKPIAWSTLLPVLSGTASATRQRLEQKYTDGPVQSELDLSSYGLTLTQPVFNLGNIFGLRQANQQAAQAEANFVAATQDLIFRVTQTYLGVLSAQDTLHFTTGQKKAYERQLEQTHKRFDVGLIAITDVHEAQARYDSAVAQAIAAENDVENAFEALREMTGQPITTLAKLKSKITLEAPNPLDPAAWVKQAQSDNAALQASRYATQAVKEAYRAAQSQHLPTIDLNGSTTSAHKHVRNTDLSPAAAASAFNPPETQTEMIALSVSMPLFASGGIYANAKKAGYAFEQAKHVLDQTERATVSQARQAFRNVNAQISQVHALQQAVISNRSALKATLAAYDAGSRTIVDVLDAQASLFDAERNYAQSRYAYILESFKLKQAAGRLAPSDLLHINEWLDYNVPYEEVEKDMPPLPAKKQSAHKKASTKKTSAPTESSI